MGDGAGRAQGAASAPALRHDILRPRRDSFDFTAEVCGLQVPTLIVYSDADMAPLSHYVEVFHLLDGGLHDSRWRGEGRAKGDHALVILPGLTHYTIVMSPLLATVTLDFLDGQTP